MSFFKVQDNENINPAHYRQDKVQCIDAMRYVFGDKFVMAFCVCNVLKYMWRFADKNGEEDVDKAKWYMNYFKMLLNINADKILSKIPFNMTEIFEKENKE